MVTRVVRVIQKSPIKPGPEGGVDIGTVYAGVVLALELSTESPHDGWCHIVGPNPPIGYDGKYLKTGKEGWIEEAHVVDANKTQSRIIIDVDWENQSWNTKEG
jgi:hypothetical protein